MSRIIAIDYGRKRCGLAVTDELQIIASPLDTVSPKNLIPYLKLYVQKEDVEAIVLGHPRNLDTSDTHVTEDVRKLFSKLEKQFEKLKVELHDERFTSKMALASLIQTGASKKLRGKKSILDETSAVILLQSYMSSKK